MHPILSTDDAFQSRATQAGSPRSCVLTLMTAGVATVRPFAAPVPTGCNLNVSLRAAGRDTGRRLADFQQSSISVRDPDASYSGGLNSTRL